MGRNACHKRRRSSTPSKRSVIGRVCGALVSGTSDPSGARQSSFPLSKARWIPSYARADRLAATPRIVADPSGSEDKDTSMKTPHQIIGHPAHTPPSEPSNVSRHQTQRGPCARSPLRPRPRWAMAGGWGGLIVNRPVLAHLDEGQINCEVRGHDNRSPLRREATWRGSSTCYTVWL